jgi:hypothetical protein
MRQFKIIIGLLSVLTAITGCATELKVTDPRTGQEYVVPERYAGVPGVKDLAELCAKEAGREIKQVVYVDGYFGGQTNSCERACWLGIIGSGLNYLELQIENPESFHIIKEPGIWKIYIAPKDDPNCNPDIQRYLSRHKFSRDMRNSCIAFKKNDQIESQYEAFGEPKDIILDNEYQSKIYRSHGGYRDRFTKEILGTETYFSLLPRHSKLDPGWSLGCGSVGVKVHFNGMLQSEVLKPKGGR